MRENWAEMSDAARETAEARLRDLRQARNRLGERYGALESGASSAWDELKTGFSDAWAPFRKRGARRRRRLQKLIGLAGPWSACKRRRAAQGSDLSSCRRPWTHPSGIVVAAALLTAIMTGVGALPFLFVKKVGDRTMGWSNAAAAGLMLAASHSLIAEGVSLDITLTLVGVLAGLGAIVLADRCFRARATWRWPICRARARPRRC